jgi:hypothetical protein
VTGTLFFVPAAGFLDDLPDPPGGGVAEDGTTPDARACPTTPWRSATPREAPP